MKISKRFLLVECSMTVYDRLPVGSLLPVLPEPGAQPILTRVVDGIVVEGDAPNCGPIPLVLVDTEGV